MSTLLFRLAGPMQSWGLGSRFTIRGTGREPTKSGVVGLLCAALGKPATETEGDGHPTLEDLCRLRLGVRIDREGTVSRDYHTAGGGDWHGGAYGVYKASGKRGDPVVSTRFYLAGAHFLVGLEGAPELLSRLALALRNPVWQLSLGRKAFVPAIPVHLPEHPPEGPGLREEGLEEALLSIPLGHPFDALPDNLRPPDQIRFVMDAGVETESSMVRNDVPVDFAKRLFRQRRVSVRFRAATEVVKR